MANISNKTDSYTKSRIAGRRLYLALKVKGISRTKTGLFSDKEWIKRNLPKTAKSLSAWFEDGIPIYSKGKDIRPIHAIADYFGIDPKYLTNDKEISEEDFLNTIINTPTISESADGNVYNSVSGKNSLIFHSDSAVPSAVVQKSGNIVQDELTYALQQIFNNNKDRGNQFDFFKHILMEKIQSDISNFTKSDFIEITNIHQMTLLWGECHDHVRKSLMITSYAAIDQWVDHPNSRRSFEREVQLISQGIDIKRIYIYDTSEELHLLLKSENVLLQIREKIELKFISRLEIQNFYYIKDIIASIEVIDAGLIDETWLFLAFLDTNRNPIKLKLCWDPNKVREYKIFLNELWHISYPAEKITT